MATQPTTAAEALEIWRSENRYSGDLDSDTDPAGAYAAAHQTIAIAKAQSLPLEELVPELRERAILKAHSDEYEDLELHEAEHPPEDDGCWPVPHTV